MKKVFSAIIAAVIVFNIGAIPKVKALGENVLVQSHDLKDVGGAKQLKIKVKIKNITLNTFQIALRFDPSKLTLSDFETNEVVTDLRDSLEILVPQYSASNDEGWLSTAARIHNPTSGSIDYTFFVNPESKGIVNGSDSEGFIKTDEQGLDIFNLNFRVKDGVKLSDKSVKLLTDKYQGYNPANKTGAQAYTKDGDKTGLVTIVDLSNVAEEIEINEPDLEIKPGEDDTSKPNTKPGDFTGGGVEEDTGILKPEEIGFSDVKNHWAEEYINKLTKQGIINGYDGNIFKPENNLTRGEFAVIISRVLKLENSQSNNFSDTTGHWAEKNINAVYEKEIIKGSNGKFRPNDKISREETITIIGRAYKFMKPLSVDKFVDDDKISSWAFDFVYAGKEKGILGGYPDNTFKPKNSVTRAEMSKMVSMLV